MPNWLKMWLSFWIVGSLVGAIFVVGHVFMTAILERTLGVHAETVAFALPQ